MPNILEVARNVKGLSLVGVVDAHSTGVQEDFKTLLATGDFVSISQKCGGEISIARE